MAIETNVALKDLQLGDVIRFDLDAYGDATVKRINEDGTVRCFRPFVHTSDYQTTGGVGCYVGIEEFDLHGRVPITRVRKGQLLK